MQVREPEVDILAGKQKIYDSHQTVVQLSMLSMSNLHESNVTYNENLIHALINLNFGLVDVILSHDPAIENCKNSQEHQQEITGIYSNLITLLQRTVAQCETSSKPALREIIVGVFTFAVSHGIEFPVEFTTDLVLKFAVYAPDLTINILEVFGEENWSEQMHAIAYQLYWSKSAVKVLHAESKTLEMVQAIQNSDTEIETLEHPPVLRTHRSLLDGTEDKPSPMLQKDLSKNHWMQLRIRFEYIWRYRVGSKVDIRQKNRGITSEVQDLAEELLCSIIILATHFGEFEYAWYWPERKEVNISVPILVELIRCCRVAVKSQDKQVWEARAWVLYKDLISLDRKLLEDNFEYLIFMNEFTRFIKDTESPENAASTLPKVYHSMLKNCSANFFPLTDGVLKPLMEVCTELVQKPKQKWQEAFHTIIEVYMFHKSFKRKRECSYKNEQYFSSSNMVLLLKLCTSNGSLDEFKMLNNDILALKKTDPEYLYAVKSGYEQYIDNRYEKKEEKPISRAKICPKWSGQSSLAEDEKEILYYLISSNINEKQ